MVTRHTGIPMMRFRGAYPPCSPAVYIAADVNPFCAGETVTFTPTLVCLDDAVSYSWIVESVEVSTSSDPYSTNTLVGGNRVILKVVNSLGQSIYSNMIIVQEKTEGCEEPGLELTFDNISNVPVADASSVSDWNTFFDLPTYGTPFASVVVDGNVVKLIGGSEITIKANLFFEDTSLIKINDFAGCVIQVNSSALFGATSCNLINFPELITLQDNGFTELSYEGIIFNLPKLVNIGEYCFSATHAHSLLLPEVTNIGNGFWSMASHEENISTIYLPKLNTIGDTVEYNDCFVGITGQTITLTIPAALMTCNAGNPDGDIQYLQANNTVTIITV